MFSLYKNHCSQIKPHINKLLFMTFYSKLTIEHLQTYKKSLVVKLNLVKIIVIQLQKMLFNWK